MATPCDAPLGGAKALPRVSDRGSSPPPSPQAAAAAAAAAENGAVAAADASSEWQATLASVCKAVVVLKARASVVRTSSAAR
jgi:hypothetical protein